MLLSVVVDNLGSLVTLVVDVKRFPPVVIVVGLVRLSVVLTRQDVEELDRLPAKQGEPILQSLEDEGEREFDLT